MKKAIFNLVIIVTIFGLLGSCQVEAEDQTAGQDLDFSFAFLTDIHLQPEKRAREGFQMAIEHVNQMKPDFVITGGDLIMDALGTSEARADSLYDMYVEMQEMFRMPVYNTMGNHEIFGIYERSGIARSHQDFGEKMFENRLGKRYYVIDHKGWRFYIFDSIDEKPEGNSYFGHVDSLQLEWLREDLSSVSPETPIAISVHIPVLTAFTQLTQGSQAQNNEGIVITNSRELLECFKDHNLKLILQGHLHILEDIYIQGVHFITGGAVSASWWDGPRGNMEEGYLWVDIINGEVNWKYIDYGWEVIDQNIGVQ